MYINHMKSYFLFFILISISTSAFAQSKWGIEIKGSRFNTTNSGQLEGGSYGFSYYMIDDEKDLVAYSQSLGLIYLLNDKHLIKLHLGNHQNGRELSITSCDDVGNCTSDTDVNAVYHYFQIAPSYTYRFIHKRLLLPIEAGININLERNEIKQYYVPVKSVNFDYEFSVGLDYRLDPELIIGLHGLFTGNINEYQDESIEYGTLKPKELGIEFSIIYEFGKTQGAED